MANFDFTQFISFDSALSFDVIQDNIVKLFANKDFKIIEFEDIESVKKDYYADYWRKCTFELSKDDFLGDFMEWESEEKVPPSIVKFVDSIYEVSTLDVSELRIIICSFADSTKTCNELVHTNKNSIYKELFKMSPFSYIWPDNLIIDVY